jgi:membrane-associated HD superfamily phosphohydrolase
MSEGSGRSVSPEQYRYPGPRPRSMEAAIVMLADSAQAAVQSLRQPTPAAMETMIKSVIRERLDDGQLDECGLTFRDIARITRMFVKVLGNLFFHTRIEYPAQPKETRRASHASARAGSAEATDQPGSAPQHRSPGA